jgi:hypothetical protein
VSHRLSFLLAVATLMPIQSRADGPPAAATAPATPSSPKVTIGGLVDSYYQANLGQSQSVVNTLRPFDGTPGFHLNYAELNGVVDAGPAALRVDLGFGRQTALGTTNLFVQQAFATYKLGATTIDFGRFVTSAGAEVIESKDNWLYSRSILFYNAIPFAHDGLRVTTPVAEGLNLQYGIVNGWDDDAATATSPPVIGTPVVSGHKVGNLSLAYASEKSPLTLNLNVYAGEEQASTAFRTLLDLVVGYTTGAIGLNLNVDYATQGSGTDNVGVAMAKATWYGVAGMVRYSADAFKVTGRLEYFDDKDGYRTGGAGGVATSYYEGTLGLAYPIGTSAELRGELRYDMARVAVPAYGDSKELATFTVGALAWF